MTDIEVVNPVPAEEARPWLANLATTFLADPEGAEFDHWVETRRRDWPADRIWGARAGGRWVATLQTMPRAITVPGPRHTTRELVADALTAVTVNVTHRRRGLLTQMLSDSLHAAKARGEPFSILLAAEWPIYGRFGYSPASLAADYTLFPRDRAALLTQAEAGAVRQVDPSELGDLAPTVFSAACSLRAGQVDRPGDWWARRLGLDGYRPVHHGKAPNYYVHESEDGPDGVLWWSGTRDVPRNGGMGAVGVGDLIAATPAAYRNLWTCLVGLDLVSEVTLERRPVDEPIRWVLSDGRALRQTYAGDDLWLRLLDVPASLSARGYAACGRVVLDVVDGDIGGYASGRYLLDAGEDGAECTRTRARADLRISQRTLASIYLGGFTLRQLAIAGSVEELTPGTLLRAETMFATTLPPWNATGF